MFEKVHLFVIVHLQRRAGAVAEVVSCAYCCRFCSCCRMPGINLSPSGPLRWMVGLNAIVAESKTCPFWAQKHRNCVPQEWQLAGYVSTEKCAGIVGCSCYISELNHNINSKWQFLDCATVAFSERY